VYGTGTPANKENSNLNCLFSQKEEKLPKVKRFTPPIKRKRRRSRERKK